MPDQPHKHIGRRISARREQLGLTREQLAAAVGLSLSTLRRLELGHDVQLSTYLRVTAYLIDRGQLGQDLAERVASLPSVARERILAIVRRFERKDGEET